MAKTIKFNLICDDKPIRTIEDLQNNFSIEDVLAYYNNKLLHRWLKVRGYDEELEKVSAIENEDAMEIIKDLIKIFAVSTDEKKVEEGLYILKYLDERKELYSIYEKEKYKVKNVIDDYEAGYRKLVEELYENPDDVGKIKANIAEITSNYKWIFHLDHRNLFYTLAEKSTLAIMCLLMNEHSRKYYLPVEQKNDDGTSTLDIETNQDKAKMFCLIASLIKKTDFKAGLGENLICFSGITDGYWKDLEPKDKKIMVIKMNKGDFIRPATVLGGDLAEEAVTNKFVIVDGLDYKSNSASHELWYMEV